MVGGCCCVVGGCCCVGGFTFICIQFVLLVVSKVV